jgi:hypothetical protein
MMGPPPLPLGYAPAPPGILRRHATKWSALAALLVALGWPFVAPEGLRLLGMVSLFPLVLVTALRLSGAVTRIALWALCLLIASTVVSISGIICSSLTSGTRYVVLPEWPLPFALMSFLWLPAFFFILRRNAVQFEHDAARRDVVRFVVVVGALFSLSHLGGIVLTNAIGGYHGHVRTLTSADGRFRAELYKGHWLGEARYHLYLSKPSPAPIFGLPLAFEGDLETATTADLAMLQSGKILSIRADGAVVGALDTRSGESLSRWDLRRGVSALSE